LSRLPTKYRVAIVLCDLQGKTRREAARQLGLPEGTLAAQLSRARVRLAKRLARHGLAVSGASLAAVLAQNAAAASAPTSVVVPTIKAAGLLAAGHAAATGGIPVKVAALTEGVRKAMLTYKLSIAISLVVVAGILAAGAGAFSHTGHTEKQLALADADGPQRGEGGKGANNPQAAEKWHERATLKEPKGLFIGAVFSPDAKTVATPSGGFVHLWDMDKRQMRATLSATNSGYASAAFSPNGKTVATIGPEGVVKLWDGATGKEQTAWKLLEKRGVQRADLVGINQLAFSPNGKSLAAACGNSVKVLDTATGKEQVTLYGHGGQVRTVAYAKDGKVLLTGSADGTVKVWDVAAKKLQASLEGRKDGHFALSADGKVIATANPNDKTVTLWDVENGMERLTLKEMGGNHLAFSRNGRMLAVGFQTQVKICDVATGKELAVLKRFESPEAVFCTSLAFSPNGNVLAASAFEWDIKTDNPVAGVLQLWELRK
jgi:WD40 repeat protein